MLMPNESLLNTAERRLEARTEAKLQTIKTDFSRRLEALSSASSPTLKAKRAVTEREMQSAIRQAELTYGTHKRQLDLLKTAHTTERIKDREPETQRDSADLRNVLPVLPTDVEALKKLSYLSDLEKDVKTTIQGHCFRLQRMQQASSIKEVMLYLSLRREGCPRQSALGFANKRRCRIDSTQRKDGPSSMRNVRRVNNQKDGLNFNGWQLHSPKYGLKSEFQPFQLKEDEIDYDSIRLCYERFEKGHRIVNGEVQKKDPVMDYEHSPSPYFLKPVSKHRRFVSLPEARIPAAEIELEKQLQVADARKLTPEPEKSIIRLVPTTMDTSLAVVSQDAPASAETPARDELLQIPPIAMPTISLWPPKPVTDAIDSVKTEASCTFTFRSLKPVHPPPPKYTKSRTFLAPGLRILPRRSTCAPQRKSSDSSDR